MAIRCEELGPEHWSSIETLFGANGACAGCWCMWWRVPQGGKVWKETAGAKAKRAFKALVERGEAKGILAFEDETPVGWCSIGPRSDFPRTERSKNYARDDAADPHLWVINCFFIARGHRGKGVATALLEAAMAACRRHGAKVIEAYPIPADAPLRATDAWRGPLPMFERQGFEEIQRVSPARPLVRKRLR